MNVALFGLFGVGNLGNEASLAAMLSGLRDASRIRANVYCVCPWPERVASAHRVRTVGFQPAVFDGIGSPVSKAFSKLVVIRTLLSWWHAIRSLRHADLFIVPGTGILDDFGEGPRGMPYELFKWVAAARLCGTRVMFVSVGAGPIEHSYSRWLMTRAAELAEYRSFRDVASLEFMAGLGCDVSQDMVRPDLVFSLPVPNPEPEPARSGSLVVGLGVMAYHGWSNDPDVGAAVHAVYIGKLVEFTGWLLAQGHEVRMLIGESTDRAACDELVAALSERLGKKPAELLRTCSIHTFENLLANIVTMDVVVATRFHNVVAALMASRPVISLGYAAKNDELMQGVGLGEYCQHVERLDLERLKEQFNDLVDRREQLPQMIRTTVESYRCALAKQFDDCLNAR